MLQVCGDYKYFYSYSAGIDMIRQNLTSTDCRRQILTTKVDPRALRAKICTAEFIYLRVFFIHLKLELLTKFPASNNENIYIQKQINISNIELLDY